MSTSPSKPSTIPSLDTVRASINTGKSFQGQLDHNVRIENPQEWPHLHIPFSLSRKKFKDLSTAEFVYGYPDILTSQTPANQSLMQQHLMSIIHLSSKYHWDAILSFHTAMLDRIEAGLANWGDNFSQIKCLNITVQLSSHETAHGEQQQHPFHCHH